MLKEIPIAENIYWIGVNDRETTLFESMWPLPRGVAYNSYLLVDEKVAVIDTVKAAYSMEYLNKIRGILGENRNVDYLVINHIEPDHSGSIRAILEAYPGLTIIGNRKTAGFLDSFYRITSNVKIIEHDEVLDLGRHKLRFFITPMVHWPETMMTFEETRRILFSGDVFGGFGTLDEGIFDDEIENIHYYEDEVLRYFSNIVGRYSVMVQKALSSLAELKINTIASTHGPVWRSNPGHIIGLYDRWSRQETDDGVVLVYASMYGNTEKMMEAIARTLAGEGITKLKVCNVSKNHLSYIVKDIWRYRAVIFGSPTYNTKLFPLMGDLIRFLQNEMIKDRVAGLFGSYGWGGGAVKELRESVSAMKWNLVEPVVESKGAATEETIEDCILLAKNIAGTLKSSQT
jgi:flavorubredoxin